ncbi:MAG: leucine-rich repeat domain-containing protein [Eggerthellaceae bacterium]|nr:leucine-rich repeat domain-containing protein [Eggerthellaceae bacterium]
MKTGRLISFFVTIAASCALVCALATSAWASGGGFSQDDYELRATTGEYGAGAYLVYVGTDKSVEAPDVWETSDSSVIGVVSIVYKNYQLEEIDLSNAAHLKHLDCSDNYLISLDLIGCPELRVLDCSDNLIGNLDISANPALTSVDASRNNLTVANVEALSAWGEQSGHSANLSPMNTSPSSFAGALVPGAGLQMELTFVGSETSLVMPKKFVSNGKLYDIAGLVAETKGIAAIDFSALSTSVNSLKLKNNNLTSVDLSKLTNLKTLDLSNNKLSSIDLSKLTHLERLLISGNDLTALDISRNTALVYLSCEGNKISDLSKLQSWLIRTGHDGAIEPQSSADPTPEPQEDDPFDWTWIIIGGAVLLVIMALVAIFATRKRPEEEKSYFVNQDAGYDAAAFAADESMSLPSVSFEQNNAPVIPEIEPVETSKVVIPEISKEEEKSAEAPKAKKQPKHQKKTEEEKPKEDKPKEDDVPTI